MSKEVIPKPSPLDAPFIKPAISTNSMTALTLFLENLILITDPTYHQVLLHWRILDQWCKKEILASIFVM